MCSWRGAVRDVYLRSVGDDGALKSHLDALFPGGVLSARVVRRGPGSAPSRGAAVVRAWSRACRRLSSTAGFACLLPWTRLSSTTVRRHRLSTSDEIDCLREGLIDAGDALGRKQNMQQDLNVLVIGHV